MQHGYVFRTFNNQMKEHRADIKRHLKRNWNLFMRRGQLKLGQVADHAVGAMKCGRQERNKLEIMRSRQRETSGRKLELCLQENQRLGEKSKIRMKSCGQSNQKRYGRQA